MAKKTKKARPDRELTDLQHSHDIKAENLEIVRRERDALQAKCDSLIAEVKRHSAARDMLESELDRVKRTFYQPDGSPLVFDTIGEAIKHRAGVARALKDAVHWEDRAKWLLSILREPNRPWDALVNWVETNKPDEDGWQYAAAVKKESTR